MPTHRRGARNSGSIGCRRPTPMSLRSRCSASCRPGRVARPRCEVQDDLVDHGCCGGGHLRRRDGIGPRWEASLDLTELTEGRRQQDERWRRLEAAAAVPVRPATTPPHWLGCAPRSRTRRPGGWSSVSRSRSTRHPRADRAVVPLPGPRVPDGRRWVRLQPCVRCCKRASAQLERRWTVRVDLPPYLSEDPHGVIGAECS